MDDRQRLICTVALHADGFSPDEIGSALGITADAAAALVVCGEKEQAEGRMGRWVGEGLLRLTAAEKAWLEDVRRRLQHRFPDLVEDIIIHGPWARGIRDPEVEKQMLVIIREGDRKRIDEVHSVTFDVDMDHAFVGGMVGVITKADWDRHKQTGSTLYEGGISVA